MKFKSLLKIKVYHPVLSISHHKNRLILNGVSDAIIPTPTAQAYPDAIIYADRMLLSFFLFPVTMGAHKKTLKKGLAFKSF